MSVPKPEITYVRTQYIRTLQETIVQGICLKKSQQRTRV